ncbi:unnamed protein product [Ectocarpus sp. 12 AP-2014]
MSVVSAASPLFPPRPGHPRHCSRRRCVSPGFPTGRQALNADGVVRHGGRRGVSFPATITPWLTLRHLCSHFPYGGGLQRSRPGGTRSRKGSQCRRLGCWCRPAVLPLRY